MFNLITGLEKINADSEFLKRSKSKTKSSRNKMINLLENQSHHLSESELMFYT